MALRNDFDDRDISTLYELLPPSVFIIGRDDDREPCSLTECRAASRLFDRLGYDSRAPAEWFHIGPIERDQTLVVTHAALPSRVDGVKAWCVTTPVAYRPFVGYHLDDLALATFPYESDAMVRPHPSTLTNASSTLVIEHDPVAIVYRYARRRDDGPGVKWFAPATGREYTTHTHIPVVRSRADLDDEERALVLIKGAIQRRPGRPSRPLSDAQKALVIAYEIERTRYPDARADQIAARIGQPERTLRRYCERAVAEHFYGSDEYRRRMRETKGHQ